MVKRLQRRSFLIGSVAVAATGAGCSPLEPEQEPTQLLGAGLHGPQTVDAGQVLGGEPGTEVTVRSDGPGAAIIVKTAAGKTTRVQDLTVESQGGAAIVVLGDGDFEADNLKITCEAGVGVAAEGLAHFVLRNTEIVGTVTEAAVPELAFPLHGADGPIVGLALVSVALAEIENVSVRGFGGFGCVLVDTVGSWEDGTVEKLAGAGLVLDGTTLGASGLVVADVWAGEIGDAIVAYGVAMQNQASLTTTSLTVSRVQGLAVAQLGSVASHAALVVADNHSGYRVQDCSGAASQEVLRIHGTGNRLERNGVAGLLVLDSGDIHVSGLHAESAQPRSVATSETGIAEMADGIQIVRPKGDVTLEDLVLEDNARVGLLLSGPEPGGTQVSVQRVFVQDDEGFGVVAQAGFPALSPDAVTYGDDAQRQRDETRTYDLATVGGASGGPRVSSLRTSGLIGDEGLVRPDGSFGTASVVRHDGLGP